MSHRRLIYGVNQGACKIDQGIRGLVIVHDFRMLALFFCFRLLSPLTFVFLTLRVICTDNPRLHLAGLISQVTIHLWEVTLKNMTNQDIITPLSTFPVPYDGRCSPKFYDGKQQRGNPTLLWYASSTHKTQQYHSESIFEKTFTNMPHPSSTFDKVPFTCSGQARGWPFLCYTYRARFSFPSFPPHSNGADTRDLILQACLHKWQSG
jgi:hypothetical protein